MAEFLRLEMFTDDTDIGAARAEASQDKLVSSIFLVLFSAETALLRTKLGLTIDLQIFFIDFLRFRTILDKVFFL